MSDRLKDFVENNREGFDDLLPGDLWAGISGSLSNTPSPSLTTDGGLRSAFLKNLPAMLKYGFGASALILGTFLIVNSQKEKSVSHIPKQEQHIDSPVAEIKTPRFNAGTLNIIHTEARPTEVEAPEALADVETAQPAAVDETIVEESAVPSTTEKETPSNSRATALYNYSEKTTPDDTIQEASIYLDTIFHSIKRIEVNVWVCNVNINRGSSDKTSLKGRVTPPSNSYFALRRHKFEKARTKLKYEIKDSVLKVWMEDENLNHVKRTKTTRYEESSYLNFEVPSEMDVDVTVQSGNVNLNGLSNKFTRLRSIFGSVKVNDLTSSSLIVKTSSGNVELSKVIGQIRSDNTFGNQTLENVKGNANVHTSSGNTTIRGLNGNLDVITAFGQQVLENISGNVVANVSSGNISVKSVSGNTDIRSSFGTQNFEQVTGDIYARASSGSIKVNDSKGKMILSTSFGSIVGKNVTLVSSANFKTSSGDIQMQLLNDIKDLSFDLKTSSGSLNVEKANLSSNSDRNLMIGQGPILVRGISSFGNQSYH